ncbi:MAG: hypothetical protein LC720_08735 [Actinobacteria bacterium]|nr:hypothetical protein [Actinomycetota bacterium]
MSVSVRHRLGGLAASVAVSALALGAFSAASAQASLVSLSACDNSLLTQPFLRWADPNSYKLAPGGDFEGSLTGWSTTGAAGLVRGSEPAGVTGSVGSSSLGLGSGASAQSPGTCVNAAYPSFRFFARSDAPGSVLSVAVVYQTLLGQVVLPVGKAVLAGNWTPTLPMVTGSAVSGASASGGTAVGLRFTELSGSAQIDDVYVDPWTMH